MRNSVLGLKSQLGTPGVFGRSSPQILALINYASTQGWVVDPGPRRPRRRSVKKSSADPQNQWGSHLTTTYSPKKATYSAKLSKWPFSYTTSEEVKSINSTAIVPRPNQRCEATSTSVAPTLSECHVLRLAQVRGSGLWSFPVPFSGLHPHLFRTV